ncbi:MAG: hypothetical protein ABSB41_09870 [Anaerolineales bacterium]|jgi:hypothetical protein
MRQNNFLIPYPTLAALQRSDAVSSVPTTSAPGTLTTSSGRPQAPQKRFPAPDRLNQARARIKPIVKRQLGSWIQEFDYLQPPGSPLILSTDPKPGPASVP